MRFRLSSESQSDFGLAVKGKNHCRAEALICIRIPLGASRADIEKVLYLQVFSDWVGEVEIRIEAYVEEKHCDNSRPKPQLHLFITKEV